ncbi:MAG: aminotransferase class I/II-fold pyridoxal phosphate-dependent enzyme, partial [Planctomycetota bacterium]
ALELIRENPSLREKLWDNITYLKSRLSQYKNAPAVHSPIIPLVIGPAEETLRISEKLYQNNILIPAIRPPTVPAGTSRLRISLMATHTVNDIDRLIEAFEKTGALAVTV